MYDFCANDTAVDLELFESARTAGGVARVMTNDSVDRLQGTYAQQTGITGAGTATRTKTITSKDISAQDHLRIFWKVTTGNMLNMSSMVFRVGTDASNYYQFNVSKIGNNWD